MLGLRAIFSWFTLCLVGSNVAAVTIDELFSTPANSATAYGTCSNNLTRLNEYASDFTTLCTQLDNAVQLAKTPGQTQAKLVARQLFTAWFGIQFNTDGSVKSGSETAWRVVEGKSSMEITSTQMRQLLDQISRLQSLVSLSGDYQAHTFPANLFYNDFGYLHYWDDVVLNSQGVEMDPDFTIEDVYMDWVATLPSGQLPYWVPSISKYYMMSTGTFRGNGGTDLCGPGGLEGLNSFGSPLSTTVMWSNAQSQDYWVVREAISDFVLICANVLADGVASAYSYGYTTLSDIPLFAVSSTAPIQLHKVRPRSAVLLHEILHMVSRWDGSGATAQSGATMILDYKCEYHLIIYPVPSRPCTNTDPSPPLITDDMVDCLSFAIQPQQVTMNGQTVTAYAYLNTENYVYFALAWWYYNRRTDWQSTTPATFYAGYLQEWTGF
ncbi:hypothetical protein N7495_008301 [Penicillium taxi]|uniref:uncharacterized protein n=1 Tax=Penicillium taxi TaxID=168475 RepID=UPI00254588A5|nr:uncharacterized protein N7495_008301 [Penicillium taxi]KAJ5888260.1 hypothetical protein N7495_008301 [Penicillium taxi]